MTIVKPTPCSCERVTCIGIVGLSLLSLYLVCALREEEDNQRLSKMYL